LPQGWTHKAQPEAEQPNQLQPNQFDLIADGPVDGKAKTSAECATAATVLRVRSQASASTLSTRLRVDPVRTPVLCWRWWVSAPIPGSDIMTKSGDDYAARLYVLFDPAPSQRGLGKRLKLETARTPDGAEVSATALCYVWGTAQAEGVSGWNAHTNRLRMIVLDSGGEHVGQWRSHRRDLAVDFLLAFGEAAPAVIGLAVGADTDTTGGQVEARFGDIRFEPGGFSARG